MKTTNDANGTTTPLTTKPCAMLGAGKLAAALWKASHPIRGTQYSFNVFHMDQNDGHVSQRFDMWDVPDLARLALVLAYAIVEDETVEQELRDDLDCFAYCLESVFRSANEEPDHRLPFGSSLAMCFRDVLRDFADEQASSFAKTPDCYHVYRKLIALDRWFFGVIRNAGFTLELIDPTSIEDSYGVCPICAKNDGYLNVEQAHWFVCHQHQTRWCTGNDLFPTWKDENAHDWDDNWDRIGNYRVVEPFRNPTLLPDNN